MTLNSPAAEAAVRRLLEAARARPGAGASDEPLPEPAAAAARGSADLADALARWFGPYGYHALLTRALAQARTEHPSLTLVRIRAPLTPTLDGLADAVHAHGTPAVVDGIAGVLGAVIDLLGRMIGDDMALHLVERSMDGPVPNVVDEPTPDEAAALASTEEGAS